MAEEKSTITPEQIAAYQQALVQQKQRAAKQCMSDLKELAASRGFAIIASPQLVPMPNGIVGLAADWGVAEITEQPTSR